MIFKGYYFRRSKTMTFRTAQPGDVYSMGLYNDKEGDPIPDNYCVFMWLKDCPEVSRASWLETHKEYSIVSPEKCSKIIPVTGHSLTNMAYGVAKVSHVERLIKIPVYLAYDGECYTAVINNEKDYYKRFHGDAYEYF